MSGRVLCVDPGEKRLGLAISDPSGSIASPLRVIPHVSRAIDAAMIAQIAEEEGAGKIIIGQPLDAEGLPHTPEARHSASVAAAVQAQTALPVELWDESGSTKAARAARLAAGVPRRKRAGHLDEVAAAIILQDYLDAHSMK